MKEESIESIVCSQELSSSCIFAIYLTLKDGPPTSHHRQKGASVVSTDHRVTNQQQSCPSWSLFKLGYGNRKFPPPPAIHLHLLINGNLNPVTRILLALRAGGLSPAGMELQLAAAPCSLLQSCVSVNKCRVSRSSVWSEDLLWLHY